MFLERRRAETILPPSNRSGGSTSLFPRHRAPRRELVADLLDGRANGCALAIYASIRGSRLARFLLQHQPDDADQDHDRLRLRPAVASGNHPHHRSDDRQRNDQPVGPAEKRKEGDHRADQRDEADDQRGRLNMPGSLASFGRLGSRGRAAARRRKAPARPRSPGRQQMRAVSGSPYTDAIRNCSVGARNWSIPSVE